MSGNVQHSAPVRGIALPVISALFMNLNNAILKTTDGRIAAGRNHVPPRGYDFAACCRCCFVSGRVVGTPGLQLARAYGAGSISRF